MWLALTSLAFSQTVSDDEPETVTVVSDRGTKKTRGGEILLSFGATYGAYAGAEAGFLIGEAVEESEQAHTTQGIAPGLLGGAAVGLTTAFVLSRATERDYESQALLYTTAGHGIFYGTQVGRALIAPDAPGRIERIHAAGLAGSMLGVGLGTAFGARASSIEDQARFSLATSIGWLTATGLNDLARLGEPTRSRPERDVRPRAAVNIASAALFGGLGTLANRTGTEPGVSSLALSLGHGAWIGAWSPLLFEENPSRRQLLGGVRLGLGVGYGSALLMSSFGEPSARSAGMQVAGWAAGSALGAGLPLALESQDAPARRIVGPMLAAGIGGQVLGAALAPHYNLDADDGILLGTLGAWTTYQAIGWGVYADYTTTEARRPVGYALTAAGAGSLVTLGLTPVLDVEPSGSLTLLSAGGWGTWYGAWGSSLANLDQEAQWLTTLGAGNGLLLTSGIALGAGWKPTWQDIGAIDGLGLVGAAAGGLTGVIFLYNPDNLDPLVISTLAGSTVGLAAGSVVAAIGKGDRAPSLGRIRVDGWRGTISALPLPGSDGSLGGMVNVRFDEVE
ncbi:MAG: hypothetical protein AAGA48_02075 [Myxococcota bacterium]